MSYTGFGKGSGPSAPPKSQPPFGFNNSFSRPSSSPPPPPPPSSSLPTPPRPRSVESSGWSNVQRPFYRDLETHTPVRSTPVTTFIASRDSTNGVTARISRFPNPERTRSPPVSYEDLDDLRDPDQTVQRNNQSSSPVDGCGHLLHLKSPPQSAPSLPSNHHSVWNSQSPSTSVQQQALSPRAWNGQASYANPSNHQNLSPGPPYIGSQNLQNNVTKELNSQGSKRTRSPPSSSAIRQEVVHKEFRRPSISPSRMTNTSNVLRTGPPQMNQRSLTSVVSEATDSGPISSTATKRGRSPPSSFPVNETVEGNSISIEDSPERETLAKAKRLARFKVELSKSEQNSAEVADQKASANRHEQSVLEQRYVGGHAMDSAGNFTNGHAVSDHEGLETSKVIIGLCPDMCPESERGERERKGDLDQYERLDGDRNVTSRLLAVKKYTRTAEREASLIRPMPILQKTIDYLLSLLDQPYDERFLGAYNFLWDRMRAIRMDLRMQHIFNQGAITMLEQMIKLHIIAMHELCEYTKGEGFSEGFDAHLNIEQMNKTSVELFQMYDDHRKKGILVPTEKEFRGYYALLKLDKHPGYKVEPAELSLDLAKMTPEIRQTPEVLFARNVARACRTGNFIAFFRLARKATYLQACLMHAHFAKLRTQALASLHSGLQNNQGLPVSHVANWLAMEDEVIEDLLEYHGFLIKSFEEPYMVKEGPFLNGDTDYPTKRSKLVHKKKSETIIEDVSSLSQAEVPPAVTKIETRKQNKKEPQIVPSIENDSSRQKLDEEMPNSQVTLSPKDSKAGKAIPWIQNKEELLGRQDSGKYHNMASPKPSPVNFQFPNKMPEPQVTIAHSDLNMRGSPSPRRNLNFNVDVRPLEVAPKPASSESSLVSSIFVPLPVAHDVSKDQSLVIRQEENEDQVDDNSEDFQDKEIADAKLKLFLRLWRRRVSKLRTLREQRQLATNAALESLPLGPPIRQYTNQPGSFDKFDIDTAMRERCEKQEKSQARLNVSEIVANTLDRRNKEAKCLCWKIILCSQTNSGYEMGSAGWWLASKLMPSSDKDVILSSPGLVIWRKWFSSQLGTDPTCCISVIRDTALGRLDEAASGANAVVFLVSESLSWELQRIHLHNLLNTIPSGACLPLLILCGRYDKGFSSIIMHELHLQDIDKSRVSCFRIVFLIENQQVEHLSGFFSDQRLREGLEWLAGESPLHPTLRCVKVRELVHRHLSSLSGAQDISTNYKLGPNDCISLFNEALDCSLQEIILAANSNPAGWPCPEIGLLDKSCDEDRVVKRYLPTLGWSSKAKIEPVICALQNCKLLTFPDNLSWLAGGCKARHEIENQRIELENCLILYLTHTCKMMGAPLATKEAHVTIQTCSRLELHGSGYRVVPHWGMIFRRIFNWRLMSLCCGDISMAYISESNDVGFPSSDLDMGFDASFTSSYNLNLTLDELISVNFDTPLPVNGHPEPKAIQQTPQKDSNDVFHNERNAETTFHVDASINTAYTFGLNNVSSEALMKENSTKEADQLSKLLEQCNLLQDGIDKKLSIYF
ncbi:SAC3 family protein B isoform X1 [Arachis stenosperma]|uniref:SAC3 family protein B isoform X1 n=1 Tax=Arachis stenosperma TaxID=217475 RepID=UPI0025AD2EE2|nr:SAC3 family protein B isoform X1 [Arachis stenosperma]